MMNVRIRRATHQDQEVIWKATMQTVWNDIPTLEREGMDRASLEDHFRPRAREIMDSASNAVFVAEDGDGRFLGYLILGVVTSMLSPVPFAFVYDIWVTPEVRRQGVATALLNHAVAWSRKRDLRSLKLEVNAQNDPARNLYKSFGFTEERVVLSVPI